MPSPTTKYQQKCTEREVKKWQKRLHLEFWSISLKYPQSNNSDEDYADVKYSTTYRKACITFYPKHFASSKKERTDTIIHELSHLFTADICDLCSRLHRGQAVSENEYTKATENAAEAITRALYSGWSGC